MRSLDQASERTEPSGEIDLRALGAALKRRRRAILIPTLLAFVLVSIAVNVMTPRFTAETQVLLENQETFFTRPDRVNVVSEQASQFDPEAVASQVQLITSRDLARRAIDKLGLAGDPEFDPLARGLNPLKRIMVLFGMSHDPTRDTADARIVTAFLEKLTVYSPPKTRVITIQFTSRDPDLAARASNMVASLYLEEQSAAKRATARGSAEALAAQIADLRIKVAQADSEREQYRSKAGLLAGSNNMTITGQQLADINSDLSKARSAQADAQAKASTIRDLIRSGKAADVTEVVDNEIVRRVSDQRVTAQAQLALESRTLLQNHPRIKELTAQLAEYDAALKSAAKQAAMTLENAAKIAGARVANLEVVLNQQKASAGISNTDEVRLRALDRVAQSYRDQLDSSTTKYQEALARETSTATPADARIISMAGRPQEASFPKKVPFIIFGTVATLVFSVGFVVAGELLSGRVTIDSWDAPVEHDVAPQRGVAAVGTSQAPPPSRPDGGPFSGQKTRRPRGDMLESLGGDSDPVFAPVEDEKRISARFESGAKAATFLGLVGSIVAAVKAFGRSAIDSRDVETEASMEAHAAPPTAFHWDHDGADEAIDDKGTRRQSISKGGFEMGSLADRIVSSHVPGRGLHIVGTSVGSEVAAIGLLIDLSRTLSEKGRAIIVDLNRFPLKLATLADAHSVAVDKIVTMKGLAELLSGGSSFAEVIYRDHASRLHFVPAGLQEADFRDFDLILDALSETYDFVVLMAPAYSESEIAKVMAPYADFIVLTAATNPDDDHLAVIEGQLIDAGAREVLVAGAIARSHDRQDVA